MCKRQKSIRFGMVAIALILISSFIFLPAASIAQESEKVKSNQDLPEIAVQAELSEAENSPDPLPQSDKVLQPGEVKGVLSGSSLAPLTGTLNIPGDYTDLAAAIADLNLQGVGSGGVTLNLIAGNPQTAPAGGYVIGGAGSQILTTTSAANPVIIIGNANTVTASGAQTVGTINDAVFKLVGADFITIQGFIIQENAANTINTPAASNNMTEFGVGLFYVTTTDGAQNNTIQNNTISLNRAYTNTFGIFSSTRAALSALGTTADATTQAGTNSNNKIYGNNISNINYAIVFLGSSVSSPQETGNDIGGTTAGTGNTITNFSSGATTLSTYITLTGSNYAIFVNHQINDNISFNSITSASVTASNTQGGILKNYSVTAPTGTITTTINNNTVTITNNPTATTTGGIVGINNQGLGTLLSTATMSMNNNTVQNCVLGGSTSTTNGVTAITNLSLPGTLNMNNNNVLNNSITATTATSGVVAGVTSSGAAGTVNMNNNIIRGFASTATSGQVQGVISSGAVVTALNIKDNQLGNASGGFFTTSTATSGSLFTINVSSITAAAAMTITGNDIRGITYNTAASAAHTYIGWTHASSVTDNINNNTFTNLNVNTTGSVTFLVRAGNMTATGVENVNNNSIVTGFTKGGSGNTVTYFSANASSVTGSAMTNNLNNFSNVNVVGSTTVAGWSNTEGASSSSGPTKTITNNTFGNISATSTPSGTITGMSINFSGANSNVSGNTMSGYTGGSTITGLSLGSSNQSVTASQNNINSFSSSGSAVVTGITSAVPTTTNISRNKLYDLGGTNAGTTVNGIIITAGTTINIFNNLIGNLTASAASGADVIRGISSTSTTTSSALNVSFNTVYLNATSSGTNFGTSALFHTTSATSTTATLNSRNNIFVNLSTPNGTGLTVAYRRSTTTLTNYGSVSNNNDFYAGTPGAARLIFYDGTNSDQTLATYKTRVAPRDSNSITENPPFLSTTGVNSNFLHISTVTPTQLESNGIPITGITDDFDGDTRNPLLPDIGADEFNGIAIDLNPPVITYTPLNNTGLTTNRTLSVTIADATGVDTGANAPRIYFNKNAGTYFSTPCSLTSGTVQNGIWDCTIDNSLIGGVMMGDVIRYFVVAQDTAGNLGSNPSAGFSGTDVNNVTSPPTTPNQYTIVSTYSGTIDVGTSETITSLTNAGGLFALINAGTVSGNVVVNLTSDLTAETGTVALNQTVEEGVGGYTIFFQASGGQRLISGSNTTALIDLNGADRVTFSGLSFGPYGITIRNTSATTGAVIRMTNDASNNGILNCRIEGGNTSTSSALILLAAGTTTGNDNNSISNSIIRDRTDVAGVPANAIASLNASTTATNSFNTITNNQIMNFINNGFAASSSATSDNWTITGNDVSQNAARAGSTFGFNTGGMTGTNLISGNSIHGFTTTGTNAVAGFLIGNSLNLTISRNRIYDFQTTAGATGVIEGVEFDGASGGAASVTVVNNFISLAPTLTTAQSITGIFDFGFGGNTFTANYNSIYIGGTASGSASSWALRRGTSAPTTYTARNNIAFNNRTGGTGNHFAGADQSANTGSFVSDFNFYAGTGATPANFMDYGTSSSGTAVSVAAWQTGPPARDANSTFGLASGFVVSDIFVNAVGGDLHIKPTAGAGIISAGTNVAGITTDYDNDPRPGSMPDKGADELVQSVGGVVPAGTYYNAVFGSNDTISGDITINGTLYLTGISNVGANTLTLGCDATTSGGGAFSYVVGKVAKQFCTTGSFTYPIGTSPDGMLTSPNGIPVSEYSPFTANVTAIGTVPSSLTVNVVDGNLAGSDPMQSVSRYWDVTETGDLTADISYTYLDQDITGTESGFSVLRRENGMTIPYMGGMVDAMTNTATAPNVTNFSQWGVGLMAPTAAGGSISGQLFTAQKQGIRNAMVMLTGGGLTTPRYVQTGAFGKYQFDDLPVGQTYVITVISKRYSFANPTRLVTLDDNVTDLNFEAEER